MTTYPYPGSELKQSNQAQPQTVLERLLPAAPLAVFIGTAVVLLWMFGNRLILGIGLSHQVVVEAMWGLSFDKPAQYMKEYLAALMPLLHGETVDVQGERVSARTFQHTSLCDHQDGPGQRRRRRAARPRALACPFRCR